MSFLFLFSHPRRKTSGPRSIALLQIFQSLSHRGLTAQVDGEAPVAGSRGRDRAAARGRSGDSRRQARRARRERRGRSSSSRGGDDDARGRSPHGSDGGRADGGGARGGAALGGGGESSHCDMGEGRRTSSWSRREKGKEKRGLESERSVNERRRSKKAALVASLSPLSRFLFTLARSLARSLSLFLSLALSLSLFLTSLPPLFPNNNSVRSIFLSFPFFTK